MQHRCDGSELECGHGHGRRFPRRTAHLNAEGSALCWAPCRLRPVRSSSVIDLGEPVATGPSPYAVVLTIVDQRRAQDASKARELLEAPGDTGTEHRKSACVGSGLRPEACGVSCDGGCPRRFWSPPIPGATGLGSRGAASADDLRRRCDLMDFDEAEPLSGRGRPRSGGA